MRRSLFRLLKIIALVIVFLVALAAGGGYYYLARTFPQTDGSLHVAGLQGRAEVIRDQNGVPNIYADSLHDLFFAQGYVHAQDRLWQMELNRHVGHGQLSELFGDIPFGSMSSVETDKYLRTIGLDRAARSDLATLDPKLLAILSSYAEGVNAFLHTHWDSLPLEFTLIGDKPSDWQPLDTVVWAKVMAYDLSGNFDEELARSKFIDALGAERADEILPHYPQTGPFIIPTKVKSYASRAAGVNQTMAAAGIGEPALDAIAAVDRLLGREPGIGSNDWVIDGTKTTTGKPLLANDPHLSIQMPAIWYTNGLHCNRVSSDCPVDVVGYTFPGEPGVVVGHNQRIAWGVTNTGPDVQDLFVEKINPSNPNQYLYEGQWEDMAVDHEALHVKGAPDIPLTVQLTRHGPIMTPVLRGVTATLALEWTATKEQSTLIEAVFALDVAQNWDEFRQALSLWDVPAQNFVYADVSGNIGYQMPGRIPIRAKGDGTVPADGPSGEYEWTGYIPFDELPFVFNPSSHFVATANNQVVPNTYKYMIARDFAAPYRAQRITDLIMAKDKLSPADIAAIQGDVYSLPLMNLRKYVLGIRPEGFLGERAMKYVQDWDGKLTIDNIGGTILEATYEKLLVDLFSQYLDKDLLKSYQKAGDVNRMFVAQLLDSPENPMWDNEETPARETRDDRLAQAYAEAVDLLGSHFGDWPPDWHWGRLHTATFEHPFGSIKPLNLLLNYGPLGVPGDGFTVDNARFDDSTPYQVKSISSMRQIMNLADWDQSLWIHSTGQSGQALDPHYTDLTLRWRDVEYAPLYFTQAAVEKNKNADLVLEP